MDAQAIIIDIFRKETRGFLVAPLEVPGDESNLCEKLVDFHLLQESLVVKAAILRLEEGVVNNKASQSLSGIHWCHRSHWASLLRRIIRTGFPSVRQYNISRVCMVSTSTTAP
jgi:hypothetical protein